jgi:SprT protein
MNSIDKHLEITMNKTQIKKAVTLLVEEGRKIYPKLAMPTVEFFDKGVVAGRAYYKEHKVSFNLTLAKENSEEFINTICHEVAHLVTRAVYPNAKQHHGPEFKRVFLAMGGNGKRCHSYDVTKAKRTVVRTYVAYTCSCREHLVTPAIHKKIYIGGQKYRCNKCSTVIKAVYEQTARGVYVKTVKKSNKA